MSEARPPKTMVPLVVGLIALFAMVVPLVAINLGVEPRSGDQPVRIAKWLDSFESFAMFLMGLTIGVVITAGMRRRQTAGRIAVLSLTQAAVVFFLAFPMMLLSRGGGFFGATHVESSYNANGTRGAHVYSTGFMECEHTIYESQGWSVRMDRVAVVRGCTRPTISWDDDGKLEVGKR